MITGLRKTQLLYVAAKLGIANLLQEGAKSSDELAHAVGAHPRALYRVLRALASLGVFAETPEGHFALTPLATLSALLSLPGPAQAQLAAASSR
jgi:DNA-binding IclR family transcriptional regulator